MVPAFNEAGSIPGLFRLISDLDENMNLEVALLIVENGSRDSTRESIKNHRSSYSGLNVCVIELDSNIGYGGALKKGILGADSRLVALLPADGKYEYDDIKFVCEYFQNQNQPRTMVKGYRVSRNDPSSVQFLSWLLTKIVNFVFRTSVIDINGLPKIFDKNLILSDLSFVPSDACFDAGLLAIWNRNGGDVREIPVSFTQRSLTDASWAGKKFKTAVRMLFRIFQLFLEFRKRNR